MTPTLDRLWAVAEAHGVMPEFVDSHDERHRAEPDSIIAILEALGVDVEAASRRLDRGVGAVDVPVVEPVVVVWAGRKTTVRCVVPAKANVELMLEDGSRRTCRFGAGQIELPVELPFGYHDLVVDTGSELHSSTVISAPSRVYRLPSGPHRGLFAPMYALHSGRSNGGGDLTDFTDFALWSMSKGLNLVATLPILAAFLDDPFEPSPYAPVSRLMWNEFYVDVRRVGEYSEIDMGPSSRDAEFAELRAYEFVDYACQARLQRSALAPMCEHMFNTAGRRLDQFIGFCEANPTVVAYAAFRADVEDGVAPTGSPERLAHDVSGVFARAPARYHAYVQWIANDQVDSMASTVESNGLALCLDLPVGVHPDGFDAWAYRDIHVHDLQVGAPPDALQPSGQNWLFPPLHPIKSRLGGHEYYRRVLRQQMHIASILRIDHVMGLTRLFCMPKGGSGVDGAYVRYPADELYAVVCLESHRNRCHVVGEDLGTVPGEVESAMSAHGLSRMKLLEFEVGASAKSLLDVAGDTLVGLNTHDIATFGGFWSGADIAERAEIGLVDAEQVADDRQERVVDRAGLIDKLDAAGMRPSDPDSAGEVIDAAIRLIARSPANAGVVALEDLWLEERAQNIPGTTDERRNWQQKCRYSLDQLDDRADVVERVSLIAQRDPQ